MEGQQEPFVRQHVLHNFLQIDLQVYLLNGMEKP